jgi:hypothetical protein
MRHWVLTRLTRSSGAENCMSHRLVVQSTDSSHYVLGVRIARAGRVDLSLWACTDDNLTWLVGWQDCLAPRNGIITRLYRR